MRKMIALGALTATLAGPAAAVGPTGVGGSIADRAVALLGCDVLDLGGPEVDFLQISGATIGGPIGEPDFEGEPCADVLGLLLDADFRLVATRTVASGSGREIVVYDLIERGR